MNFEINEMEYYPIPLISQLSSYESSIIKGDKESDIYKTSIYIKVEYFDNEMVVNSKDIILPFEINLGDNELTKIEINKIDIQVIDNQGVNIDYNLNVEISEVLPVENVSFVDTQVTQLEDIVNIEETKEEITSSYETIISATGIREEIPLNYEDESIKISSLKDDFLEVKVLFNVNVDEVDKIAFANNLSIDSCYKKFSKDKTRLII